VASCLHGTVSPGLEYIGDSEPAVQAVSEPEPEDAAAVVEQEKQQQQQQQQQQSSDDADATTTTAPASATTPASTATVSAAEVQQLRERLAQAEESLRSWRGAATDFTHASCFGPRMCAFLRARMDRVLTETLLTVEGVTSVRWVRCSFPSSPSHAPQMDLVEWQGLGSSTWDVQWAPPWAVQVCLEAKRYIPVTVLVNVQGMALRGRLVAEFASDMSEVALSFVSAPTTHMDIECDVTVSGFASMFLPFEDTIKAMMHSSLHDIITNGWVRPHSTTVTLSNVDAWRQFDDAEAERAENLAHKAAHLFDLG
jgi:hypothetical protein